MCETCNVIIRNRREKERGGDKHRDMVLTPIIKSKAVAGGILPVRGTTLDGINLMEVEGEMPMPVALRGLKPSSHCVWAGAVTS